ncbi:MAG: hypothetical protein H0V54_14940 [Chthoniobacterales bacterium]|nr:hypothetical protein [Chthoniobacterales bacterium]
MTRWYWKQVGGTLIEEFCAVERVIGDRGGRWIDGVVIKGGECKIARQSEVEVAGKDIMIIQAKDSRLGMWVMGQAFFSAALMEAFKPRSIESIALVAHDDSVLGPIFRSHDRMRVVVCPGEVMLRARMRFSVKKDGIPQKPFSETEIFGLVEKGKIDRSTPCRRSDEEQWSTVAEQLLVPADG